MGIRFNCPNGHKLNVKAELAGKIGICPKCQARMLIPLKSTRHSHKETSDNVDEKLVNDAANNEALSFDQNSIVQHTIDTFIETKEIPPLSHEELLSQVLTSNKQENPADSYYSNLNISGTPKDVLPVFSNSSFDQPQTPVSFQSESSLSMETDQLFPDVAPNQNEFNDLSEINVPSDPHNAPQTESFSETKNILDDPNVVWYLRAANQTYGPASNIVIKNWLYEKRIAPDMFVWREGWTNWLEAKNVFPELESIFASDLQKNAIDINPRSPSNIIPDNSFQTPEITISTNSTKQKTKKKSFKKEIALIIGLVCFIILLLIILVFILLNQKKEPTSDSSTDSVSWLILNTPQNNQDAIQNKTLFS